MEGVLRNKTQSVLKEWRPAGVEYYNLIFSCTTVICFKWEIKDRDTSFLNVSIFLQSLGFAARFSIYTFFFFLCNWN